MYYLMIPVNRHAFNMATKLKQSRLHFMINNATASLNDVDDGPADEPANIPEATDSNKELKKEQQGQSESGKPRSKKARAKPQAETLANKTYLASI